VHSFAAVVRTGLEHSRDSAGISEASSQRAALPWRRGPPSPSAAAIERARAATPHHPTGMLRPSMLTRMGADDSC